MTISMLPATFDAATLKRAELFPPLAQFASNAERILALKGPAGLWECLPAFEQMVRSDFAGDLIRCELARAIESPFYMPAGTFDAMQIARSRHFTLLIKVFKPLASASPSQIYSMPEHILFGSLGPGLLNLDVYHETPGYHADLLDRSRPIAGPVREQLHPGEIACFHAGHDAVVPGEMESPALALIMVSQRVKRLQWVYSAETRLAERILSADPMASRLEFAVHTLAELDAEDSVANLRGLCEHPEHFVRWSAIRGLIRIDFQEGLAMVRKALKDPHPHVRNAAARALQKMEGDGLLVSGAPAA